MTVDKFTQPVSKALKIVSRSINKSEESLVARDIITLQRQSQNDSNSARVPFRQADTCQITMFLIRWKTFLETRHSWSRSPPS